jgi:hypothetical protein
LRRSAPVLKTGGAWKKKLGAPAMLIAALFLSWFLFYALGGSLENMTAPPPQGVRL